MSNNEIISMWTECIEAYRSRGLSAKKWSEANQVNFHALNYWVRKLKKEASKIDQKQWLSVEIPDYKKDILKPYLFNGFLLHYKRLEKGTFKWLDGTTGTSIGIGNRELR
ncbi:IS66 family insertion sequence element accessory protein TnpA [Alkaliphilus metalliredigens]|nr:hypothetical protein [Alkaliphilus metalliredigens]